MKNFPPLARRALLTLGYVDQFEYPLSIFEIWFRLISSQDLSLRAVVGAMIWLRNRGLVRIERSGGVVWLMLSSRYGLSAQRRARERFSEQKILELQPLLLFVRFLPWVSALAVTGSVAVKNAKLVDDTDLLIVARPGSIWLVRPVLIAFAWLMGKRRSWRAEEPDSWCFNLWLESNTLQVGVGGRSVYTAYEVVQAQWLYDREGCAAAFLAENKWVGRFLPRWYQLLVDRLPRQLNISWILVLRELILRVTEPVWCCVNVLLYGLQRLYMQPHKTRERVSLHAAYFHPRNTQATTSKAWRTSLRSAFEHRPTFQQSMSSPNRLPNELASVLRKAQQEGLRIVLATGVFDVLHQEHVTFLEKAARLGDFLLVGVESDERVRQIKGQGRPIHPAQIRARQVAAVPVVTAVVILPTQFATPEDRAAFLRAVRPNYFAVSASSSHLDKKQAAMVAVGGKLVVVHEHNPKVSTTQLLAEQTSSITD